MTAHHITFLDLIMSVAALPLVALMAIFLMQEVSAWAFRRKSHANIFLTPTEKSDELALSKATR